ncbi:MAG: nucleoside triphosphate pyrophosphohydrolase [bacterium]|nr:nucleoside triphosphate pyrophosphohydrolase [bacterium]
MTEFHRLIDIVRQLRHPVTGCPWDIKQTHSSIRPYLLEETYELLEAIDAENDSELMKELGDVLLQVALHSQIASDREAFTIDDVAKSISDKLVRRHPHVFGDIEARTAEEVMKNWEKIKLGEESSKSASAKKSLFDGIPGAMPALARAFRISEKAAHVGFDWKSFAAVEAKIEEELAELEVEINSSAVRASTKPLSESEIPAELRQRLEHEFGDVLFSLVQYGRWLGLSPEDCLRKTCDRFISRFQEMESNATTALKDMSEDQLETLWEAAKSNLAK